VWGSEWIDQREEGLPFVKLGLRVGIGGVFERRRQTSLL
jgi:hypothetical protein